MSISIDLYRNAGLGNRLDGAYPLGDAPIDWLLPAANVVSTPAVFDPVIVHPRPDLESSIESRHRKAYDGLLYEVPVSVFGGTKPYKYELTNNTTATGATIGETFTTSGDELVADANYGVVSWTPSGSGTSTIEVLITDQDARTVTVSWDVVVGTSTADFVFVSTAGNDANDGSIGSPVTISDLDSGDHAGKIAIFRAGTHTLDWETLSTGTTPRAFIGYPSESVTIDCSSNRFALNSQTDIFFGDLICDGNPAAITKQFTINGPLTARHCYFRVTNQNMTARADSNGGAIVLAGLASQHMAFVRPVLSGQMGAYLTAYGADYTVIEHGTTSSCSISQSTGGNQGIIYFKELTTNATVFNFDLGGATVTSQLSSVAIGSNNTSTAVENIEICYSRLKLDIRDFVTSGTYGENNYYYRNNIEDQYFTYVPASNGGISTFILNNVLGGAVDVDAWATITDNLENNLDLTSTLDLSGATRTTYLGTRGAEVAG